MNDLALSHSFRDIISAIARGSLEELDALIRYDVVDHNLMTGQGDGRVGLKYWARTLRQIFPDLSGTVADAIVQGNKVAGRVLWAGTNSGSGRDIPAIDTHFDFGSSHSGSPATDTYLEFESFYILRYEEGVVVEWWDSTNADQALRTLGAKITLPPKDA